MPVQSINDSAVTSDLTEAQSKGRFPSPTDWRDKWIYFIMVDRFNNPNHGPRFQWNDGVTMDFQGGVFEGIRQQLDYLQELGVGALWLSPVLQNCQFDKGTYHGYGIQHFLAIDPRFAVDPSKVEDELKALIHDAHQHGMHVIFDIVLHHTGDVFTYDGLGENPGWSNQRLPVLWKDSSGRPKWTTPVPVDDPNPLEAVVWPKELQENTFFEEQGVAGPLQGDFSSLRAFAQQDGNLLALPTLIRTYKDIIAKYDVDGFRIDTLRYISPQVSRIFSNTMREFARTINKENFFLFGEIWDTEDTIAQFVGRDTKTTTSDEPIGIDAALDFPLFSALPGVCKGMNPPSDVVQIFQKRKEAERTILSTHGDASGFFVTFLDNHDQHHRFYYQNPADPDKYNDQVTLALGCLLSLPGVPCIYYGTEEGLSGDGSNNEAVREALWGKPGGGFNKTHPFYQAIQHLNDVRNKQPALRSGRYYFRPISGDSTHFGISPFAPGVLAYSRILDDQEVVIVANIMTTAPWDDGKVIIDGSLNHAGDTYTILYSNKGGAATNPGQVIERPAGTVEIKEVDGSTGHGPLCVLPVHLQPMEIQILRMRTP